MNSFAFIACLMASLSKFIRANPSHFSIPSFPSVECANISNDTIESIDKTQQISLTFTINCFISILFA